MKHELLSCSIPACVTVDGDSLFLQRADSIEGKVPCTPHMQAISDEDTISVCSLDDQVRRISHVFPLNPLLDDKF